MWHFQAIHHGLFDWDFPTGPNLLDITVDGREIKAIAQVSKQAFTYVLDRVTGEPVWPIEERPVPQGNVPGEWYSPTQPFPTKPPPFDRQGIAIDDLIDFTPELRAEALEIADRARFGPLFSPPVLRGAEKPYMQVPGAGGGANWQGAAVDPETGRLFVSSSSNRDRRGGNRVPRRRQPIGYFTDPWGVSLSGPQGLPLFKPPYKRVTALDLNTGDQAWMQPHGGWPQTSPGISRSEPAAARRRWRHYLGTTGDPDAADSWNHGGRDYEETAASSRTISAYDKDTGKHLGSVDLPAPPGGNPVTYLHEGKQHLVVAIGRGGTDAELIALTLP